MGACTDSNYAAQYGLPGTFSPIASYELLEPAVAAGRAQGGDVKVGNVLSSDHFYLDDPSSTATWQKMGVLAVEMEAAALYMKDVYKRQGQPRAGAPDEHPGGLQRGRLRRARQL